MIDSQIDTNRSDTCINFNVYIYMDTQNISVPNQIFFKFILEQKNTCDRIATMVGAVDVIISCLNMY